MGYLILHVDFLVTEGNISDAHERVASVNFIILITPKGKKKKVSGLWYVSKQNSEYNLELVKIGPMGWFGG